MAKVSTQAINENYANRMARNQSNWSKYEQQAWNDPWFALGNAVGSYWGNQMKNNAIARADEKSTDTTNSGYDQYLQNALNDYGISNSGSAIGVSGNNTQNPDVISVSGNDTPQNLDSKIISTNGNGTSPISTSNGSDTIMTSNYGDLNKQKQQGNTYTISANGNDNTDYISTAANEAQATNIPQGTLNNVNQTSALNSLSQGEPIVDNNGNVIGVSGNNGKKSIPLEAYIGKAVSEGDNTPTDYKYSNDIINQAISDFSKTQPIATKYAIDVVNNQSNQRQAQDVADKQEIVNGDNTSQNQAAKQDKVVEMSQSANAKKLIEVMGNLMPDFSARQFTHDLRTKLMKKGVREDAIDYIVNNAGQEAVELESKQAIGKLNDTWSRISKGGTVQDYQGYMQQVERLGMINPQAAALYQQGVVNMKNMYDRANKIQDAATAHTYAMDNANQRMAMEKELLADRYKAKLWYDGASAVQRANMIDALKKAGKTDDYIAYVTGGKVGTNSNKTTGTNGKPQNSVSNQQFQVIMAEAKAVEDKMKADENYEPTETEREALAKKRRIGQGLSPDFKADDYNDLGDLYQGKINRGELTPAEAVAQLKGATNNQMAQEVAKKFAETYGVKFEDTKPSENAKLNVPIDENNSDDLYRYANRLIELRDNDRRTGGNNGYVASDEQLKQALRDKFKDNDMIEKVIAEMFPQKQASNNYTQGSTAYNDVLDVGNVTDEQRNNGSNAFMNGLRNALNTKEYSERMKLYALDEKDLPRQKQPTSTPKYNVPNKKGNVWSK
ncbi:MAG: hypothetical protein PHS04_04175 [Tissierellia bacterium]|nr:hypothetical protein [Tissierellia bacterium]